ncbi:MAG: hypothetical protein AB3N28_09100 [Kordiimonas sp.]
MAPCAGRSIATQHPLMQEKLLHLLQIPAASYSTINFLLKFATTGGNLRLMTDIKHNKKPQEKLKSEEKQARLAEALRQNLRRRKEQSREKKTSDK